MSKMFTKESVVVCAGCILALGGISLVLLFVVLPYMDVEVPSWAAILGVVIVAAAAIASLILPRQVARLNEPPKQAKVAPQVNDGANPSKRQVGPSDGPSAGQR
jgi:hypothetical protein